jgi:transposase InsO family protein
MLSHEALLQLFDKYAISETGQKRIHWIRENAPVRRVHGGGNAVSVRYVPRKMPFTLEAEAFNTEYAALFTFDHDEETLEIYPQPTQVKITYINHSGKKVSPYITPDFFLIRKTEFVFVECKTEEELRKLALAEPNRYVIDENGRWRSPPAERAAQELGCNFIFWSTKDNNWALIENLEFLGDYLGQKCPQVPEIEKSALKGFFSASAFATISELIKGPLQAKADSIYSLIAQGELYFDLLQDRLSLPEHAIVYRDEDTAQAYRLFARTQTGLATSPGASLPIEIGARFIWDGRNWEIVNSGTEFISARPLDGDFGKPNIIELTRQQLERLTKEGKIHLPTEDEEIKVIKLEAEELLRGCSEDQLRTATDRYQVLFGHPDQGNPLIDRKKRTRAYWMKYWREAEQKYGYGLLGLIPNLAHTQGNRSRKLSDQVIGLIQRVISEHWETPKRKLTTAIYGALRLLCHEVGVEPPSRTTLRAEIKRLTTHKNLVNRLGKKAAYSEEPEYLILDYTTPRHGTRPFHIAHIDHTPLDIVLLDKSLLGTIKSLWLTLMIDAYSRKVLAFYLSYDPPSYRSNMMVIRECVRRHGRIPSFIVVDRGSDFESTYFETLLARLKCHKKRRPAAKPRNGSLIERLFRTTLEEFIYSLLGNTQAYVNFRQVSPEVDPARHAAWVFDRLSKRLDEYFEQVYHKNIHSTLGQSPEQMFLEGVTFSGSRDHTLIPYNRDFLINTCPSTAKGTARVTQHGVKINYLFYKSHVFLLPGIKGTDVQVRYEPFNKGLAYAYVNNKWHEIHSDHYALFSQLSERSIRIASTHIHLLNRRMGKVQAVNAERLASFLRSIEGEEALLVQQKRDAETQEYRDEIIKFPKSASNFSEVQSLGPINSMPQPKLLEDF